MSKILLAVDPGWATGISAWEVRENEPIRRIDYELIQGGPRAFAQWWWNRQYDFWNVVCEEFIQDGRTPRVDDNALKIEGFLLGVWGIDAVIWHRNSMKAHVPDKLLRQHGLWLTGKQVGWKDGNDVNDSQRHALAWGKLNHAPTAQYFWGK